ncbi:4-hydroxy-tetrahydrodipicolinate reductase [Subsaximicrobium wynnwilliamsii]|uniref:4-hydroxy-tetrahydrodipicolinate reductase n=1 Tax=Subsaximicrobium wynnwilliamsii TaxID=291179 RepID=A0A5C6ZRA7_9FLAO|nr:4-hydroxy-tetrahydrodipicolinate reductase [Subsaximicrobium wynnwilliamsii]TXD85087.1 4-hydroxy-tetrahydrodipicolinate reductase [Subsaximicrobium wynnwilliamsii]TXD91130.1 4-hydroxy-tetrahydrodipicolinate reductase [Subsaximicrobium wynnwilliamsii]TXE04524.1 4-hydroxy-tetrahydrodipicolinate reductase [Subsaximicrobium wynnwilliamsii]
MNIALLGYGKMGKTIETIGINRGHHIVLKYDGGAENFNLENCDVAIDFSLPTAAVNNISTCLKAGVPVISGTTGWLKDYDKIVALCKENKGTFLYASNFSLGVNIFFKLNATLAKLMSKLEQYKANITETHHTQKRDAPSGTAITLAEGLIENSDYSSWTLDSPKAKQLGIEAKRIDDVPGTHEVVYKSQEDSIQITHTAHSRQGFALGAVIAAEFVHDKKGIFTMKDVLNIS